MNEQEEVQQNNMISNLPLLFANGYPTSLDKITESQLEKFIPFMVQCSLGHINLQGNLECSEPEWWPEDLPFEIPFTKPSKFIGNWKEKMKEIIIICYQFHKSVFLLRFCCDLASYEQASLRFINNYNSTTSLFDRRNNKLLVTFRNENMSYDQPFKNRKCLMQQKTKTGNQSHELQHTMVEQAPFDIYLCDYCDAELYSKDAILEHEKICNNDDDVILCDSPQSDVQIPEHNNNTKSEDDERRIRFLLNFNLQCRREKAARTMNLELVVNSLQTEENISLSSSRKKRLPKRNRTVHSLARSPTIPLSSPAGLYLVKTTKTSVAEDYITERLDRVERFCSTPLLTRTQNKPKFFDKKTSSNSPHCTFRKPQEYSSHIYVFPRRQFSQRRRIENYLFFNALLMKRCRPISVRLKKISDQELKCKKSSVNSNLNIKLTRDTTQSSNWKISNSTTDVLVETIDLCSSEDEESSGLILKEQFVDENLNTSKCLQSKSSFEILATKKLHIKGIQKELPLNKIFTSNAEMQLNNSCCDPTESTEYKKVNQTSNPLHHAATTDTTIKICISGTAGISCIASPPVASQNLTLPYLIQPPNNYQNVYKKNGVVSRSELTNEKPFNDRPSMASFLTTHNKQKFGVENSSALAASTLSLSQSTQSFSSDQHGKMLADISLAKQLPSSNCIVSIDLTT